MKKAVSFVIWCQLLASLLVPLAGHAQTPTSTELEANLALRLEASDRTEMDSVLAAYATGRHPRALAVSVHDKGTATTTQATGMRTPAEAAVEAISRCERLRAFLATATTRPCELVHADDAWIETAAGLMTGINDDGPAPVWRIDGGNGRLWLAGSVHILKSTLYPLAQAFESAFADADRIALEIDPLRMVEADRRLAMQTAITASPDSVRHALGDRRLASLAPLMQRHGIQPASILSMKPAILATQISIAELAALGYMPDQGIDLHFAKRAREQGKPVLELETVEQQMQVLAGGPLDVQVMLLDETLKQTPRLQQMISALLRAWLAGDADSLYNLMTSDYSGNKALETYGRRIIDDRNHAMFSTIKPWLGEDVTTLVIVGAGHLGGPEGLLRLFETAGYTITGYSRSGRPLPDSRDQLAPAGARLIR